LAYHSAPRLSKAVVWKGHTAWQAGQRRAHFSCRSRRGGLSGASTPPLGADGFVQRRERSKSARSGQTNYRKCKWEFFRLARMQTSALKPRNASPLHGAAAQIVRQFIAAQQLGSNGSFSPLRNGLRIDIEHSEVT
jgi:hypothetical protein